MPTSNGTAVLSKTILVTGAGGFVGGHLFHALRAAFPAARIIGTGQHADAGLIALDITRRDSVRQIIAAEKPDFCIHLAGIAAIGTALANPDQAWAVNLHGTLNIADAIQAEAPQCRLMFISSSECYGSSFKSGQKLDESAVLAPMNLYAATKAAADLALGARAGQGLRLLRLRPFNHTGPGQNEDFVIPAFAGQIARIEAGLAPPEISVGTLESERDFLDVRDVCAAYVQCVAQDAELPNDAILNIASGHAVKIATLLEMLLANTPHSIKVRQDPARLRPVEIPTAIGDATRAMRLLHWQPKIPLSQTLDSVLDFARQKARAQAG
jgi:GDP-4-dehydro-6-deoxy-D-mannose reductase